jgi:DNA-binding IscR family transcriptional regulator
MTSDFMVAVHSLVYLYHNHDCVASSEELAKNICTNPARVRKVMAHLKQMGVVTTREGHVGGYCAGPNLGKLDLATIAKGLDTVFVEAKWHSGSQNFGCKICRSMAPIFDEIYAQLDTKCKEELGKLTIAKLDKEIFAKK